MGPSPSAATRPRNGRGALGTALLVARRTGRYAAPGEQSLRPPQPPTAGDGRLTATMQHDVRSTEPSPPSPPGRTVTLLVLGVWAVLPNLVLAAPAGLWVTLSGLPLIALLLGLGRSLPILLREGLALTAPLGMLWALNRRALGFWWMGDDPCHLVQILDYGIWKPFTHSVGYFLTPLLNFSLGLDLELFGLRPAAFYGHQLISFAAFVLIAYGLLRTALPAAAAGLALTLFAASLPAVAVAQQLMNRHYLEGLALLLTSFALYRRARLSGRLSTAVLGSVAYFLSTAAKEVFVPLVLLLPFFDPIGPGETRGRERWRLLSPYALALGLYGAWRLSMLGWHNNLSAYGALSGRFEAAAVMRRLPQQLGFGGSWLALLAAALLAAAAWSLWRRSPRLVAGLGTALALLALPLTAVAGQLEPRHMFAGALLVAVTLAAALDLSAGRRAGRWSLCMRAVAGAALVLLALAALTRAPLWSGLERSTAHYRTEGTFVLESPRQGMLLTTLPHTHHLECLARLRRDLLHHAPGPGFCGDLCYCSQAFAGEPLWTAAGGEVVRRTDRAPADCSLPGEIDVDMRHDRRLGRLSWQLGPYDEGAYRALLLSRVDRPGVSIPVTIPRRGSMQYREERPLRFVMQYQSPAGWRTYSPVYVVEPGGGAHLDEPPESRPGVARPPRPGTPDGR